MHLKQYWVILGISGALIVFFFACNHPDTFLPIEEPATVQYIDATGGGLSIPVEKNDIF